MQPNRLILNKIIYAKRQAVSSKVIEEIIKMDIQTHLRYNPDLFFHRIDPVIKNADRSYTYPLIFATYPPIEKK